MRERSRRLFFQLALYGLVRAANDVPQLKQRLLDDEIIEYDQLAVMTPVMTAQEGFRQVWCDNAADFAAFSAAATPKIDAAKRTAPAPLIVNGENFFCASCLPWLHFSAMTHAEYYVGAAVPALTGQAEKRHYPGRGQIQSRLRRRPARQPFFRPRRRGVCRTGYPLAFALDKPVTSARHHFLFHPHPAPVFRGDMRSPDFHTVANPTPW